jgi:hypothetical protein
LTPLGRTRLESTMSCARAPSAKLRINAQSNQIRLAKAFGVRLRRIIEGELATKSLPSQALALESVLTLNAGHFIFV